MAKGFYTDTTICIGCKACQVACHQWNELPAEDGGSGHRARCRPAIYTHPAGFRRSTAALKSRQSPRRATDWLPPGSRWLMMSDVSSTACAPACSSVPGGGLCNPPVSIPSSQQTSQWLPRLHQRRPFASWRRRGRKAHRARSARPAAARHGPPSPRPFPPTRSASRGEDLMQPPTSRRRAQAHGVTALRAGRHRRWVTLLLLVDEPRSTASPTADCRRTRRHRLRPQRRDRRRDRPRQRRRLPQGAHGRDRGRRCG